VLAFLIPDVPAWTAVLERYPTYFTETDWIDAEDA
jgi:hypothetical protein